MSVIKPEIDTLLDKTEHNPFLLCSVASKRACDINNMVRGQHLRVTAIQTSTTSPPSRPARTRCRSPMQEIEDDTLKLRQGGL